MAIKSHGTRLWVANDPVGSITAFTFDGREASIIDVTNHGSADNAREFIGGLVTPPTLSIEGFFDIADAGQSEIRNGAGSEKLCLLAFSDGSGFAFYAVCKSDGEAGPLDDAVPFTAALQLNKGTSAVYPTMTISGTLNSGSGAVTFPALIFAGISNSRPKWADTITSPDQTLAWDGDEWVLTDTVSGSVWKSTNNVLTPDQATTWTPVSPATGTPTVTES